MQIGLLIVVFVFLYLILQKSEGFYATLSTYNNVQNVKLEPSSYCRGGSYMNSSNEARSQFCSQAGNIVECAKGFSGRPIGFSYFHV